VIKISARHLFSCRHGIIHDASGQEKCTPIYERLNSLYQKAPFSLMLFRAVPNVEVPHPSLHLAVPLQVGAKAAQSWDEAH
jgi:hypothetical protein